MQERGLGFIYLGDGIRLNKSGSPFFDGLSQMAVFPSEVHEESMYVMMTGKILVFAFQWPCYFGKC